MDWSIQIHYKNLYNTEKQNLKMILQCGAVIMEFTQVNKNGEPSIFARLGDKCPKLYTHYQNYKFYAEPV